MRQQNPFSNYFVFAKQTNGVIILVDAKFHKSQIEASEFCENANLQCNAEALGIDPKQWPAFIYRSENFIKRNPVYLKAFKDFFGVLRLDVRLNDKKKPSGIRFCGIPPGVDLKKCRLDLVASMQAEPFVTKITKPIPVIKKKAKTA